MPKHIVSCIVDRASNGKERDGVGFSPHAQNGRGDGAQVSYVGPISAMLGDHTCLLLTGSLVYSDKPREIGRRLGRALSSTTTERKDFRIAFSFETRLALRDPPPSRRKPTKEFNKPWSIPQQNEAPMFEKRLRTTGESQLGKIKMNRRFLAAGVQDASRACSNGRVLDKGVRSLVREGR